MRLLITILFSVCIFNFASAQKTTPAITIKGTLIDSTTQAPLSFVTITLKNSAGQAIRSVAAKDNGTFLISAANGESYQLAFVFIGYKNKTTSITTAGKDINLGKVSMSPTSKGLKEVVFFVFWLF